MKFLFPKYKLHDRYNHTGSSKTFYSIQNTGIHWSGTRSIFGKTSSSQIVSQKVTLDQTSGNIQVWTCLVYIRRFVHMVSSDHGHTIKCMVSLFPKLYIPSSINIMVIWAVEFLKGGIQNTLGFWLKINTAKLF